METASLEQGIGIIDARMRSGQPEIEDSEEFFDEMLRSQEDAPKREGSEKIMASGEGNEKDGDEKNIVKEIADLVDKKFLSKKSQRDDAKKKARARGHKDDISYKQNPGEELHSNYKSSSGSFYKGSLQTATDIYREHFLEYAEKKAEEQGQRQENHRDLDYNAFEAIIKTKKMNDIMSGGKCGGVTANVNPATGGYFGFENMGATTQERWAFLKLFTYNFVLSMLRYSMSLT